MGKKKLSTGGSALAARAPEVHEYPQAQAATAKGSSGGFNRTAFNPGCASSVGSNCFSFLSESELTASSGVSGSLQSYGTGTSNCIGRNDVLVAGYIDPHIKKLMDEMNAEEVSAVAKMSKAEL